MHSAVWAIENGYAQGALTYLTETQYEAHMAAYEARVAAPAPVPNRVRPEDRMYAIEGGVAMIPINGVMTMKPTSFGGCSTILTRRAVRMASIDQDVKSIVLLVNSPGGTVEGTEELALVVGEAAKLKNVTSYIQGGCHSAAFWVSVYSSRIVSHRLALCGSIGAMNSIQDTSEQAAKEGRRTILVASRPLKGQGTPGVPVSPEAVKMLEGHIQYFGDAFDQVVLSNRKLTAAQAKEAFTGGTFTAPDALRLGLIDAIQPFDEVMAELQESAVTVDDVEPDVSDGEIRDRAGRPKVGVPTDPQREASALLASLALRPTISAREGGDARPRAENPRPNGAPENTMSDQPSNWKNRLADAFRSRGKSIVASNLDNTTREDPDHISRVITESIDAQVADHLANDPLSRAVGARNIRSVEDLNAMAAHAAIGERLLNKTRAETHRLAVVAFGEVNGPRFSASVDHLPYDQAVEMCESFRAQAGEAFETTPTQPASRRTVPTDPTARGKDATENPNRAFDKLDATAKAMVIARAPDDEKRQDALAAEYLKSIQEIE